MRTRSLGLSLAATVALIVSACGSGTASTAPTEQPSTAATSAPSEAAMSEAPTAPTSGLRIGVVTDVGTVDDKNFNQYSYEGAQKGAADIGAGDPQVVVPKDASEYAADIDNFVSQGYDIIVTVGFNLGDATTAAAKANPNTWFIGVDQAPCIDTNGDVDTTFACAGDPATLLPHLVGLQYEEDQAGYLAGIVAGSITKTNVVGAIGGINSVPAVVRYIQGYVLGAQSVNSSVSVKTAYVSTSDFTVAFNDPGTGKSFASQFISTNNTDVLFQVAGKTGNGVLEAACAAGIYGIGVDVDQWLSLSADTTPTYNCIVTSAEKHLSTSVEQTIQAIAAGTATGGIHKFDATNDGIGASPEHDGKGIITSDIQAKLDAALAGMKDGSLTTCPSTCGQP
jgi:basic membrane protein A and related proteins